MVNSKEIQEYLDYEKEENYKAILNRVYNEEKTSKSKFLKIVATLLITIIGTTGIVFASVKIYNEYIKKSGSAEVDSPNMKFTSGVYKEDIVETKEDEEWYEKNRIEMSSIKVGMTEYYYKTISNIEDYKRYKAKLSELPELSSEDFYNNFFVLVGINRSSTYSIRGLTISDVSADENTTYIKVKQKENPKFEENASILYSIVDKSLLREIVKFDVEIPNLAREGMKKLEDLPSDYSKEEAIADGCFVIDEKGKIIYDNINALDDIIKNSEKGIESYIRIYGEYRTDGSGMEDSAYVIDLQYKNNFFMTNYRSLDENKIRTMSTKYLTKIYNSYYEEYNYELSSNERMIKALGRFLDNKDLECKLIYHIPASQFE